MSYGLYGSRAANLALASATSGGSAEPTFRSLVAADLPTVDVPHGGTGVTSATAFAVLCGGTTSTGAFQSVSGLGSSGQVLTSAGAGALPTWTSPAGGGTVTSVGLSMPAIFSVANSPVTGADTLTVTLATQSANIVWAGPTSGAAATPTFRSLVTDDLAASIVTYAKIQNVTNNRLLGNVSGGAAAPAEMTMSVALDILSTTRGALLYRGAALWLPLTPGTAGLPLVSAGSGADPAYTALAASGCAAAVNKRQFMWVIFNPTSSDSVTEIRIPWGATVKRLGSVTKAGTFTFNIEERTTIGSAGTDILSADQVADVTGEETTSSFNLSTLTAGRYLYVAASAASSCTEVSIWLEVEIT